MGGPHALGDEFRWVDGQITYGFDSSFVNYFGTEGIKQINAAMQIINSLPALSTITTNDLLNTAKYPLVAWRYNGTAQALNLRDLKSTALAYVLEGLGLAQPERFAWTLRSRSTSTVNLTNYLVFNRNFDPVTFKPTSYVNGERYSYRVREFSNPDFADAVEFIVDKAKPSFSSVAGGTFGSALSSSSLSLGSYYINLTRDDVGGLRYLYQRFNQNIEGQSSAGGTFLQVTNYDNATIQTNYDLALFSIRSLTNNAVQLANFYPGLVITQTLSTVKPVTVVGSIELTNGAVPWSPDGANLFLLLKTNWLQTNVVVYNHKFANIYTNTASTTATTIESYDVVRTKDPLSSVLNPLWTTTKVNSITNQFSFLRTNIPAGSFNIVTRWLATGVPDISRFDINRTVPPLELVTLTTNILYSATSLLQVTNYDNVAVQTNYDLTLFGMRSLTNNAAALIGLYPGLVVTQTLSTVTPLVVIDQVYPDPAQVAWSAAGIFQPVVLKTNYLTVNVPVYFHKYANVFTNLASRSALLNYRDVSRVKAPFSSGSNPTYVTNVVNTYVATNLASGSVNFVTRWLSDGSPDFSRYPIRMNDSGYYLTGSDIVKLPTLIQNLNQAGLNTPAGHVKARLSSTTLAALSQNLPSLTANLITDLNVLIDTTVFNADLVATLDLRPETYLLYIQGATGSEARRLNRMLLEDAFPGQLLRLLPSVPLVERVTYTTNILYAAVNLFQGTTFRREQVLTFTNIEYAGFPITLLSGESVQREQVIAFTNSEYAGFPITSVAVGNGLRGGVDKLMLTNVVYNDLNPASFRFTNSFPIYTVTNGVSTVQTVERIQTQPDILFSAADLGTDADGFTPITVSRGSRWIDGTALNTSDPNKQAGSGPGEIGSGLVISFSKILPVHLNIFPGDITENTGANGSGFGSVVGIWGSYDGSTNAPTLYPKDITLELLEKKLFR